MKQQSTKVPAAIGCAAFVILGVILALFAGALLGVFVAAAEAVAKAL